MLFLGGYEGIVMIEQRLLRRSNNGEGTKSVTGEQIIFITKMR